MLFDNCKIVKKTKLDELKDDVMMDYYKRLGFYDVYQLGQISVIETLVNYIDKEYCVALLKNVVDDKETSEKVKKVAETLLEKYSKEPKFEL